MTGHARPPEGVETRAVGWSVERRWPMLAGGAVLVVMAGAVLSRGLPAWLAVAVGIAGGWMIGFAVAAVRR